MTVLDDHTITILSNIGIISFVAISAYLLLLAGLVSFGQQAFFGLGAYAAGIATVMWSWPIMLGLVAGALAGAVAAAILGVLTLRLRGLYFAIATLAFAEMVRLVLELTSYRRVVDGEPVGPDGIDGFRDIRAAFAAGITPGEYLVIVLVLLSLVSGLIILIERHEAGRHLRATGEDETLAEVLGINVNAARLVAVTASGAIAGLGGGLYAHMLTYLDPKAFGIMLGVHSLAYGLIGGLGTVLGPILGVIIDIGLLESTRLFKGYRMIVFGGLVAVLLIWRPRGLLDEAFVRWAGRTLRWRRANARR
jgi:branched-chain amino acid transport system permease protein